MNLDEFKLNTELMRRTLEFISSPTYTALKEAVINEVDKSLYFPSSPTLATEHSALKFAQLSGMYKVFSDIESIFKKEPKPQEVLQPWEYLTQENSSLV